MIHAECINNRLMVSFEIFNSRVPNLAREETETSPLQNAERAEKCLHVLITLTYNFFRQARKMNRTSFYALFVVSILIEKELERISAARRKKCSSNSNGDYSPVKNAATFKASRRNSFSTIGIGQRSKSSPNKTFNLCSFSKPSCQQYFIISE